MNPPLQEECPAQPSGELVAEQVLSSNYPSCEKIRPATGAVEFAIFPPMHIVSGLVGDHDVDAPRLRSAAVIARLAG
jgi:hypothetical protein